MAQLKKLNDLNNQAVANVIKQDDNGPNAVILTKIQAFYNKKNTTYALDADMHAELTTGGEKLDKAAPCFPYVPVVKNEVTQISILEITNYTEQTFKKGVDELVLLDDLADWYGNLGYKEQSLLGVKYYGIPLPANLSGNGGILKIDPNTLPKGIRLKTLNEGGLATLSFGILQRSGNIGQGGVHTLYVFDTIPIANNLAGGQPLKVTLEDTFPANCKNGVGVQVNVNKVVSMGSSCGNNLEPVYDFLTGQVKCVPMSCPPGYFSKAPPPGGTVGKCEPISCGPSAAYDKATGKCECLKQDSAGESFALKAILEPDPTNDHDLYKTKCLKLKGTLQKDAKAGVWKCLYAAADFPPPKKAGSKWTCSGYPGAKLHYFGGKCYAVLANAPKIDTPFKKKCEGLGGDLVGADCYKCVCAGMPLRDLDPGDGKCKCKPGHEADPNDPYGCVPIAYGAQFGLLPLEPAMPHEYAPNHDYFISREHLIDNLETMPLIHDPDDEFAMRPDGRPIRWVSKIYSSTFKKGAFVAGERHEAAPNDFVRLFLQRVWKKGSNGLEFGTGLPPEYRLKTIYEAYTNIQHSKPAFLEYFLETMRELELFKLFSNGELIYYSILDQMYDIAEVSLDTDLLEKTGYKETNIFITFLPPELLDKSKASGGWGGKIDTSIEHPLKELFGLDKKSKITVFNFMAKLITGIIRDTLGTTFVDQTFRIKPMSFEEPQKTGIAQVLVDPDFLFYNKDCMDVPKEKNERALPFAYYDAIYGSNVKCSDKTTDVPQLRTIIFKNEFLNKASQEVKVFKAGVAMKIDVDVPMLPELSPEQIDTEASVPKILGKFGVPPEEERQGIIENYIKASNKTIKSINKHLPYRVSADTTMQNPMWEFETYEKEIKDPYAMPPHATALTAEQIAKNQNITPPASLKIPDPIDAAFTLYDIDPLLWHDPDKFFAKYPQALDHYGNWDLEHAWDLYKFGKLPKTFVTYFFVGSNFYVNIRSRGDKTFGPYAISDTFGQDPHFPDKITAAFVVAHDAGKPISLENHVIYFISGTKLVKWDQYKFWDTMFSSNSYFGPYIAGIYLEGPCKKHHGGMIPSSCASREIKEEFVGMTNDIDAAFAHPTTQDLYFFRTNPGWKYPVVSKVARGPYARLQDLGGSFSTWKKPTEWAPTHMHPVFKHILLTQSTQANLANYGYGVNAVTVRPSTGDDPDPAKNGSAMIDFYQGFMIARAAPNFNYIHFPGMVNYSTIEHSYPMAKEYSDLLAAPFINYFELIHGHGMPPIEIIGYRVVKHRMLQGPELDGSWSAIYEDIKDGKGNLVSENEIQSFFVPYKKDGSAIKIIDTQIKEDTEYFYNVMALVVVYGTEYEYNTIKGEKSWAQGTMNKSIITKWEGADTCTPFYVEFCQPGYKCKKLSEEDLPDPGADPRFVGKNMCYKVATTDLILTTATDPDGDGPTVVKGEEWKGQFAKGTPQGEGLASIPKIAINVKSKSRSSLIEVPLIRGDLDRQKGVKATQPGVLPAVMTIIPYSGVNNKLLINFEEGNGEFVRDGKTYSGLGIPMLHLLYRSTKKPVNEQDFLNSAKTFEIKTYAWNALAAMYGSSKRDLDLNVYIDNVEPNKKYYYATKTTDNNGKTSFLSSIYSVELVDDGGVVFPIIEEFIMEKKPEINTEIKFKKKVRIKPSFLQSAPNKERVSKGDNRALGFIEEKDNNVFSTRNLFKFRVTSNKSKRKIDLNVRFVKNKLNVNSPPEKDAEKILSWTGAGLKPESEEEAAAKKVPMAFEGFVSQFFPLTTAKTKDLEGTMAALAKLADPVAAPVGTKKSGEACKVGECAPGLKCIHGTIECPDNDFDAQGKCKGYWKLSDGKCAPSLSDAVKKQLAGGPGTKKGDINIGMPCKHDADCKTNICKGGTCRAKKPAGDAKPTSGPGAGKGDIGIGPAAPDCKLDADCDQSSCVGTVAKCKKKTAGSFAGKLRCKCV